MSNKKNRLAPPPPPARKLRVVVMLPSGDMIHTDTAMCLIATMKAMNDTGLIDMAVVNSRSSILTKCRWKGVKDAMQMQPDKIFFIDSDMKWQPPDFYRLCAHKERFVSGVTTTRTDPPRFIPHDEDRNPIDFTNKTEGLIEVHTTGLAFACLDANIFKQLPEPWFEFIFREGVWYGEDITFCHALHEAKINRWVDAAVRISHVGTKAYKL